MLFTATVLKNIMEEMMKTKTDTTIFMQNLGLLDIRLSRETSITSLSVTKTSARDPHYSC